MWRKEARTGNSIEQKETERTESLLPSFAPVEMFGGSPPPPPTGKSKSFSWSWFPFFVGSWRRWHRAIYVSWSGAARGVARRARGICSRDVGANRSDVVYLIDVSRRDHVEDFRL